MKEIEYSSSLQDDVSYVDIEDDIVESVLASPHSKMLFRIYDSPVELEHKEEAAYNLTCMGVRYFDSYCEMKSLINRSVTIMRSGEEHYPKSLVKEIMRRVTLELPRLDGLVGYPIVTKSGDFVTTTGYNTETNLFVSLDTVFDDFVVPGDVLTNEDIAEARQKVSRAFAHVPMSNVNQSKYVAALLTLVMRTWFDVAPLMCFMNKDPWFDEYDVYLGALFFACDGTDAQHARIGNKNYMEMVGSFKRACENGHTSIGVESLDFVSKKAIQDCLTLSGKQFNDSNLRNTSVFFGATPDSRFVSKELRDKTLLISTNKVKGGQRIPEWVHTHDDHEVRVEVFQGLLMLVSSWLHADCPMPSRPNTFNSMFDDWYNCVAGVLEHNGYSSISL